MHPADTQPCTHKAPPGKGCGATTPAAPPHASGRLRAPVRTHLPYRRVELQHLYAPVGAAHRQLLAVHAEGAGAGHQAAQRHDADGLRQGMVSDSCVQVRWWRLMTRGTRWGWAAAGAGAGASAVGVGGVRWRQGERSIISIAQSTLKLPSPLARSALLFRRRNCADMPRVPRLTSARPITQAPDPYPLPHVRGPVAPPQALAEGGRKAPPSV